SPLYLEALINYEDRWFYYHPGINPWSLIRAAVNYIRHGQVITGGSTLTMQVARILEPHDRTITGKLRQIFRAIQLELHYSKTDILTMYLNYAPFGGPIDGVQAACYTYLSKSASELSHAEAALLAVLPQAPSRLRPDRHSRSAAKARDKVLDRLVQVGIWTGEAAREAKMEKVVWRFEARPLLAPLLAQHLRSRAYSSSPVRTTLDVGWQQIVADQVQQYIMTMPAHTSAAALVVENSKMTVKAYVGSADFLDDSRFGHVDMVRAYRSPGSLLKPFLYALALEEGLIHSESLLVDAPTSFSGYRPLNFSEGFSGPVSAGEALNRSLNIPAVDLLDRIGPNFFDARLKQGGLTLKYPHQGTPNLSMILGGVGTSLEDLVGAYSALAREGLAAKPRYTLDSSLKERRMMSPGAAYIIRKIMQENPRPDRSAGRLDSKQPIAWKTGTSYGYRDAWAVGVTDNYTVGIWVGRPDGTPSPGQYGRATAAPLLFRLMESLPRKSIPAGPVPESVRRVEVCWPLGGPAEQQDDRLCHQRRTAWILNNAVPPTFPDRMDQHWLSNPVTVMNNPQTG
ncbi:MAG: penicillin-binding protein 1C, partial [Deltaproteobacteria bacterium]|nr:penicillin-binding protein 1C [Deltaproteobacteria bacterium]